MKRRDFINTSFSGLLIASGISKVNSLIPESKINKSEQDERLIFVETSGSPDEMGYNYGKKVKNLLTKSCEARIKQIYKRYKNDAIENGKKRMLRVIENNFPYIVEEMRGIAVGAGISFDDYSLCVLLTDFDLFSDENDGCSNILFKESDYGPLLGKTLDGGNPKGKTAVIRLIKPEKGITVLCLTRICGISTETGLNDRGFGLGESSLLFHTHNLRGVRRNLLLRPLLSECSNVEEGTQFVAAHPPISLGFHYTMIDINGNAAIAERSPIEYYVRRTQDKVIYCTNHPVTPCMSKIARSRGIEGDRNSSERFQNIRKVTSAPDYKLSLESMKKLLRNHNKPGGICQHGDANMYTLRGYINIVKERKLLVTPGRPCENEFKEYMIK